MLYIWMPDNDAAWRWRVAGAWQTAATLDALLHATSNENQKEAIIFFPSSQAQLLQQPMSRAQLRQIGANGVRYLLEEYSLTPVDQLSVHYQLDQQQQLHILALPNSVMSQYQHVLALGSWRIQAVLPDFLLAPLPSTQQSKTEPAVDAAPSSEASLLQHDSNYILRVGEYQAYSAEQLDTLLEYFPELTALQVWGELSELDQKILDNSSLQVAFNGELPASFALSDAQLTRHAFNILPKSSEWQISGYWKAIAAVLVAVIAVQLLYDGLRVFHYQRIATQTKAQAVQQLQAWFPEERKIINLKRQFEAHLRSNSTADMTALALISRVSPLLQQAALPASHARYQDDVLELTIVAKNLPALESLRSQLDDQGLKAELGAVNPANGQVSGVMRVQL